MTRYVYSLKGQQKNPKAEFKKNTNPRPPKKPRAIPHQISGMSIRGSRAGNMGDVILGTVKLRVEMRGVNCSVPPRPPKKPRAGNMGDVILGTVNLRAEIRGVNYSLPPRPPKKRRDIPHQISGMSIRGSRDMWYYESAGNCL